MQVSGATFPRASRFKMSQFAKSDGANVSQSSEERLPESASERISKSPFFRSGLGGYMASFGVLGALAYIGLKFGVLATRQSLRTGNALVPDAESLPGYASLFQEAVALVA